ncbi:Phage integrase family protein [Thalassovita litoralis]|uniref:Phage integrase family protein n=1 Tax=Thalassovita litoralis TaxID=1010611 RepID=A0A521FG37_9RHOB|nr:tyrosine-type recombinase/integrase [Thalassovita litoralis]SMO95142.1 Phage integrase family protein [Thalassovita litoralis]
MKIKYPGLVEERLPSGNLRYRVRPEGNPKRKIRLNVTPDHPDFVEEYLAARAGAKPVLQEDPAAKSIPQSIEWLAIKYGIAMDAMVKSGQMHPATRKQRKWMLERFCQEYGDYALNMPSEKLVEYRDTLSATPGAADNMVKSIRAMFVWAIERGMAQVNPATGVGKINRGQGGAKPWTIDDLKTFRKCHPAGTTAHLCLTLFMFTACRISDAVRLGRQHEVMIDGVRALRWQPVKKGSAEVIIPMMPPLYRATRAAPVIGETYLLTDYGKPFRSPEGLRNRLRKWCNEAGLHGLSSHGIRKATGHLLAHEGCTQYQIMTIHGHTQAKTSEVYTKGLERWRLAADAMKKLEGMEW